MKKSNKFTAVVFMAAGENLNKNQPFNDQQFLALHWLSDSSHMDTFWSDFYINTEESVYIKD